MGTFTIRHTFDVDEDTFWEKTFKDPEYNRRLYEEKLQFSGYEVLEEGDQPDGSFKRRVRTTPKADAPKAVQKLLGGELSYIEDGVLKDGRYRFKITPSKLAEKIHIDGELWAEKKGDKKVERLCRMNINVKIFGVGGLVESFVEKTTKESYDKGADFTRDFIRDKGL